MLFNGPRRPHVDLPFLGFALPVAAAVTLAGSRPRWNRWLRLPTAVATPPTRRASLEGVRGWVARWPVDLAALALVAIVGAAVSAGVLSELSVSGSFAEVATHPWDVVGHRPAVVAGGAWFVMASAWARGLWLGSVTLTLRHAAWSLAVAGAVYLGVFIGRGADHTPAFRAASSGAGWLFFVTFPLAAAAIALVHQRDLERQVLTRASARPSGAWVAVLAAPMAGIAAVALLLAVLVGPAAPGVGHAIAGAAGVAWSGISAAALFLWHLLPRGHAKGKLPTLPHGGTRPGPAKGHHHRPPAHPANFTVADIVSDVVGALAALAVLVYVLRNVRLLRFRRRRPPTAPTAAEDRDSLFTWRHLLDQLRSALLRLLRRLLHPRRGGRRGPAGRPNLPGAVAVAEEIPPRTVRDAYRRLLVAARQAGAGRRAPETTQELEERLAVPLNLRADSEAATGLRELTDLYEAVRYGTAGASPDDHERAVVYAEAVIPALRAALAPPEPPSPSLPPPGPLPPGP